VIGGRGGGEALEITAQTDIGIELIAVLVKVQEGGGCRVRKSRAIFPSAPHGCAAHTKMAPDRPAHRGSRASWGDRIRRRQKPQARDLPRDNSEIGSAKVTASKRWLSSLVQNKRAERLLAALP
jgi:hypothetical protein